MKDITHIPDNFEFALFLQREPTGEKVALFGLDVLRIEAQADVASGGWICGHCGRKNINWVELCSSCGAPAKQARNKGCVWVEGWLPRAGILYSLVDDFDLFLTIPYCGRPDVFREEELVYRLEKCSAGPVTATDVLCGCRNEGECPDIVRLSCAISCDCIFVGAPWREDDEQAPEAAV